MTWSARRRAWEAKRLGPALDRAPERRIRFTTISDTEVDRLYGPWSWQPARRRQRRGGPGRRRRPDRRRPPRRAPPPGARPLGRLRSAARRRAARRAAVHPRHPPDRLPEPALDDADVRRLRRRRGHEPPLQVAARRRPDRPLDRLRHADALRLRHRRPRGRGRVRDVRRRRQQPGRHGGPARRPAARPGQHVDDDQLAGRADLGDVHRRRREGRRAAGGARGHAPERHPQGVRRPEGVPVPAGAVDAPRDRHDRVRDARDAAVEHDLDQRLPHPRGRLDRDPGARLHDRRRHGLRRGRDRARPAGRRLRPAAAASSSTPTATSSRRSRSSGPRAGSGSS